ncbi:peptidase associated/transthyretin-like domain-containing protein [Bizionia paragorgiae]|nr:hypothetical protein [Bizionia paragorgiae]
MGKSLIIFIFLFTCFKNFSQVIIIVDSLNKKPLPFVGVKYNNTGFYTSKEGLFNLNQVNTDSIEVSLLGYKKLVLKTKALRDTIYLNRETYTLKEVVLTKKKNKTKQIKPLKSPKSFGSWVIQPKSELLISIYPKDNIKDHYIDKIKIYFSKVIEIKELKDNSLMAYVRLHIYDIKDGKPFNSVYSSNAIDVNSFKKDEISLDISNNLIVLKESGLFIGLELIGYYKNDSSIINNNPIIRPTLTNKINKDISSKTFVRSIFKNQYKIEPINELLKRGRPAKKEIVRNLNIGLELSN